MKTYYLLKNGKRIEQFDTFEEAYAVCYPLYSAKPAGITYAIETVES